MTTKNYGIVTSIYELNILCSKLLAEKKPIGLDCETGYDGPDKANAQFHPEEGFVVGISLTNSTEWARYIPLRHDFAENLDNYEAANLMKDILFSGLVVPHNADFERRMLSDWLRTYAALDTLVIDTRGYFPVRSDTMIEAAVLSEFPEHFINFPDAHIDKILKDNPEYEILDRKKYVTSLCADFQKHGLKPLVEITFCHKMKKFEDLFPGVSQSKKKSLRFNILDLTPDVVEYACEDALWALALHIRNYPKVKDSFIYNLEMSILQEVLHEMEDDGLLFDWIAMREDSVRAKEFLNIQNSEIMSTLSDMVGDSVSINLGSPKQVSEMLYEKLGFKTTRMTKTSQDTDAPKMSTDSKALEGLAQEHPVIRQILEWKEVKKLIGSYLDKYERDFAYDIESMRVHPSYNQSYVISGRFSVSEPGIQQLPAGNYEIPEGQVGAGKKITRYEAGDSVFEMCFRDYVVAPEGWYGVGFDLSQAELRALAGEAGEPSLIDAFSTGVDVHVRASSMLFDVPEDQVTKIQRSKGKTLNFSLLYGQGIKALAESLGVSFEEAKDLYDKYFAGYTKIGDYIQQQNKLGRTQGFVTTKFGRKMTIWEYKSDKKWIREKGDRMTVNLPIQGSATGDYPKIAMVRAKRAIKKAGLRDKIQLVMNVHDALEFYVHNSLPVHDVIELLHPEVIFPVPGWPSMVADWHIWQKWGSAKDLEKNEKGIWDLKKKEVKITKELNTSLEDLQLCLTIEPQTAFTSESFNCLSTFAKSNPGENTLVLEYKGHTILVSDSTSLNDSDSFTISRLVGNSMISWKEINKSKMKTIGTQ